MSNKIDSEMIAFNPKLIVALLGILTVFVSLVLWVGSVNASSQQNTKDLSHQDAEIELLKTQLGEMKIQLSVIQEQNKQLKYTLEEVKKDVVTIKNGQ